MPDDATRSPVVKIKLDCKSTEEFYAKYSGLLSSRFFVPTPRTWRPGTEITVVFLSSEGQLLLDCNAAVQSGNKTGKVGVYLRLSDAGGIAPPAVNRPAAHEAKELDAIDTEFSQGQVTASRPELAAKLASTIRATKAAALRPPPPAEATEDPAGKSEDTDEVSTLDKVLPVRDLAPAPAPRRSPPPAAAPERPNGDSEDADDEPTFDHVTAVRVPAPTPTVAPLALPPPEETSPKASPQNAKRARAPTAPGADAPPPPAPSPPDPPPTPPTNLPAQAPPELAQALSAPRKRSARAWLVAGAGVLLASVLGIALLATGGEGSNTPASYTAEINKLIELSDQAMASARLVSPTGDGALGHLARARAIQSDHPGVTERLGALAAKFEEMADSAIASGDFAEAAAHLDAALIAEPGRASALKKARAVSDAARQRVRERAAHDPPN